MQQPPDIPLRSYQQKHHTPFISTPTPTPFYINKKTLPIISLFDCSSIKTYLIHILLTNTSILSYYAFNRNYRL